MNHILFFLRKLNFSKHNFIPRQVTSPSYVTSFSFFFCMIPLIINLLCDFVIFIITIVPNIISALSRLKRDSLLTESSSTRLRSLIKERSKLIIQRENISRKIANAEASIQNIQNTLATTSDITQTPPRNILPQRVFEMTSPVPSISLRRVHSRNRRSSIGIPYLLPFTPPRTSEEKRCNSIIVWVLDCKARR
jgi:hypothetical protein